MLRGCLYNGRVPDKWGKIGRTEPCYYHLTRGVCGGERLCMCCADDWSHQAALFVSGQPDRTVRVHPDAQLIRQMVCPVWTWFGKWRNSVWFWLYTSDRWLIQEGFDRSKARWYSTIITRIGCLVVGLASVFWLHLISSIVVYITAKGYVEVQCSLFIIKTSSSYEWS